MADLRDPLFKGCTRPVLYLGIPLAPLVITTGVFVVIGVWTNFFFIFLCVPILMVMRSMVEKDDQQFRLVGIKILYRTLNFTNKLWGTTTYSPFNYKKR